MAINRKRFYLGRPGRVRALESLTRASNPRADESFVGATNQTLSGRTTRDVFAIKKSWQFTWERLLQEEQYQRLRAYLRGHPNAGAFRIVDPRNRNLLRAGISLGGSDWLDPRDFEIVNSGGSTGGMVWIAYTGWPTAISDFVDGGLRWTVGNAGAPILRDRQTTVVWSDSSYRFSFYAYGTGSVRASVRSLDAAGALIGTTSGSTIALTPVPTRYEFVYAPPGGVAEAQFGLQAMSAANEINTTGWYVGVDEATMLPWVLGAGTPEVLLDLTTAYPWPGQYHCVMTVREV